MPDPTPDREPEPDFSGPRFKTPRPPGSRYPVNGAGPDNDEMIELEFFGHAEAFGVPHPDRIAEPHELAHEAANAHEPAPELDEMAKAKIASQDEALLMKSFKVVE
jgi:hypothetical protein